MIKLLDKHVSDKIAAGEVIERPVSVIKELLENSVDANAKTIVIDIKNGGKSYIRVTDNGIGIPEDEVETAFLRHATGKIEKLSDLNAIYTLGFRGEALASIAAVTRLSIVIKRKEDREGTKLTIHGGKTVKKEKTGCPDGTTFIIEDLFYNTPARKKFLKSDGNEGNKITDLVSKFALNYADVAIKLIINNSVIFATNGDGDHLNAIKSIFPSREYANLIKIDHSEEVIRVFGYVSNPGNTKTTRQGQIFFVNGRIIDSKLIEKGIKLGYGDRIFSGFPICILFIEINPEKIDVNIHPNKKEIRFHDESFVVKCIKNAIGENVFKKEAIHEFKTKPNYEYQQTLNTEQVSLKAMLKEEKKAEKEVESLYIEKPLMRPFSFDELTIKGYILNTYIVTEDEEENVYFIDQHAAHERIFYEKLIANYRESCKLSQPVLTPIIIETDKTFNPESKEWLNILFKIGYIIEEFGENTYIIREIPENMTLTEGENFVKDYIDYLKVNETSENTIVIDKIIMKSCKNAVKGDNKLSEAEQIELLGKLRNCENPFNCPHGRPTFVKFSKYDIERAVHRK